MTVVAFLVGCSADPLSMLSAALSAPLLRLLSRLLHRRPELRASLHERSGGVIGASCRALSVLLTLRILRGGQKRSARRLHISRRYRCFLVDRLYDRERGYSGG